MYFYGEQNKSWGGGQKKLKKVPIFKKRVFKGGHNVAEGGEPQKKILCPLPEQIPLYAPGWFNVQSNLRKEKIYFRFRV